MAVHIANQKELLQRIKDLELVVANLLKVVDELKNKKAELSIPGNYDPAKGWPMQPGVDNAYTIYTCNVCGQQYSSTGGHPTCPGSPWKYTAASGTF